MTNLLWAGFGIAIGTSVLHAALGLARPVDRVHLSFACIMALLAADFWFEWELSRSTARDHALQAFCRQVFAAHGFLAFVLVFVPAYSRVRVPPAVLFAYWSTLTVLVVADLVVPHTAWFAASPELVRMTFRGEPFTADLAAPMSPLQYVHAMFVLALFVLASTCALAMVRRGDRKRGLTLVVALLVVAVHQFVDFIRDPDGLMLPFVSELGLLTWGIIMSVQLATEFRRSREQLHAALHRAEQHAAELATTVDTALAIRDRLNTPLQTLELALAIRAPRHPDEAQPIAEMCDAIAELTHLGRAVEQTTYAPPERRLVAQEDAS